MALKTDRALKSGRTRTAGAKRESKRRGKPGAVRYRGTKASLLRLIKERGGATTSQLAQALGLTRACVHSHVTDLIKAGLVSLRETLKEGRGRPGHLYELTLEGENHFPRSYAKLASDVLTQLERASGAAAVAGVLEARNSPFGERWRQASEGRSLTDKLAYLAERLSEQGFEAKAVSQDGDYLLLLGNCPFPAVAREHPGLCEAEGKLHQEVLGVPVQRESRIVDGARCCTYRLLLG